MSRLGIVVHSKTEVVTRVEFFRFRTILLPGKYFFLSVDMFLKYCATEDFDLNLTFRSVKQNYGAQFSEVQTMIQAG